MKILMVLEADFPPDTRVENEIQALAAAGNEVHIACISHNKEFSTEHSLPCTIHKQYMSPLIHKSSVGTLRTGMYFRYWERYLSRILEQGAFKAIHIHDLPLAKVGIRLSRKYKLSMTLDLHENWPALLEVSTHTKSLLGRILSSQRQWKNYEKWAVQNADNIIVVVDEAKDRVAALGADPSRIHVVSNTLSPEHFTSSTQKDGNYITMVYGGGVNFHRGLQTPIEALPELIKEYSNIRLWIVGGGSYLPALKTRARELGLEKYVTFYGWKPLKELLEIQSRADYALIPHLKSPHTDSTIPHKLFQYMYTGIPIITSDCIPLQRIVEETETGISFKNLDATNFVEQFKKLESDTEFRKQMPARGRKWVEEKYNWENDSRVLLGIYAH